MARSTSSRRSSRSGASAMAPSDSSSENGRQDELSSDSSTEDGGVTKSIIQKSNVVDLEKGVSSKGTRRSKVQKAVGRKGSVEMRSVSKGGSSSWMPGLNRDALSGSSEDEGQAPLVSGAAPPPPSADSSRGSCCGSVCCIILFVVLSFIIGGVLGGVIIFAATRGASVATEIINPSSSTITGTNASVAVSGLNRTFNENSVANGLSSKKGLGYTDISYTYAYTGKVSWIYNWAPSSGGALPENMQYYPMLWGSDDEHINAFVNVAGLAAQAGATHVMGFNEPELVQQSNISPKDAADVWAQVMTPLAQAYPNLKFVSPAVSGGGNAPGIGLQWLQEFLGYCTGCKIDAFALHWYGPDAMQLAQYLIAMYDGLQQSGMIWLTEFAGTQVWDPKAPCKDVVCQSNFYYGAINFLENTQWIEKYAGYGAMPPANNGAASGTSYLLVDSTNKALTQLGQVYAAAL